MPRTEGCPVTVTIDKREPVAYIRAVQAAFPEATVVVDIMETGDVLADLRSGNRFIVERKTVGDLTHSVADGRWGSQSSRLREFATPVLLIEGLERLSDMLAAGDGVRWRGRPLKRWSRSSIDGLLLTAQRAGLLVAHCPFGADSYAARLVSLFKQLDRTPRSIDIGNRNHTGTTNGTASA